MAEKSYVHQFNSGQILEICQGDITRIKTDLIVNAANAQLMHGGGVAAAIAQKGGEAVEQESRDWIRRYGSASHAQPAVTSGGDLPCRYIIHAVGPVWGEGDEDQILSATVLGCMRKAEALNATSITFPAISTGIYGFPKDRAANIFMHSIQSFFMANPGSNIENVKIVLLDSQTMTAFSESFLKVFGESKEK